MDVVTRANTETMEEIIQMGKGSKTLEQVLEEAGWTARWEARGRAEGESRGRAEGRTEGEEMGRRKEGIEIARNALAEGATPEFVRKITGLPAEVITTL